MRKGHLGFRINGLVVGALLTNPALLAMDASSVRLSTNSAEAGACKPRGTVHAEMDSFFSSDTRKLYEELKKKAADLDANVVVLLGCITTVPKRNGSQLSIDGEAYKCAGLSTEVSNAVRQSAPAKETKAPGDALVGELQEFERQFFEAQKAGDKEKAGRMLAESATITSPKKKYSKAEFISNLKADSRLKDIEFEGLKATMEGDVAVLTGVEFLLTQSGRDSKGYRLRIANKYSKSENGWQLISVQYSVEK